MFLRIPLFPSWVQAPRLKAMGQLYGWLPSCSYQSALLFIIEASQATHWIKHASEPTKVRVDLIPPCSVWSLSFRPDIPQELGFRTDAFSWHAAFDGGWSTLPFWASDAKLQWDAQFPIGNRLVKFDGHTYKVSMFHQLHCLRDVRTAAASPANLSHAEHLHIESCLHYLIQMTPCHGDLTLVHVNGSGRTLNKEQLCICAN